MTEPIVVTESLGGSALSRAARAGALPQWYGVVPRDATEWRRRIEETRAIAHRNWLRDLEPALAPSGAAHDRIHRAAEAGVVVTTGQQPGLFGGPLMTLIKALTARALADTLERATGIPVAPVFWAATDDADFDEAAVVSLAAGGGARELRLGASAPAGTPMARVPIGAEIEPLFAQLRASCGSSAHASYLEAARRAYAAGATVGDAYVALLRELLEPLGIAVLDASHECVTRAGSALLSSAAVRSADVADALRRRTAEIERAAFTPQVEEVPGLSLVFLNGAGIKRRLTFAEAAAIDATSPSPQLSATVLLRPILERAILPTAAYVGGPGEIAYFAQVSAVAGALAVPAPLVVPRWSATVIESRVQRILTTLGASAGELADPHAPETRLARARVAPEGVAALRALRDGLDAGIANVAAAVDGIVSPAVFEGLKRTVEHRVARAERRVLAGVKRREAETMREIATARGALYPHGARQERKLAYIALLARNGPPLLDRLLEGAQAYAQTLVVSGPTEALAGTRPAVPAR